MLKSRLQQFNEIVPTLERDTGGVVHLIRIKGVRCSYVAGKMPQDMPFILPQRVRLDDEWSLMFYPGEGKFIDREQIRRLFE